MWYHAGDGRGEKDMVVLPYKDRLELFSRYLQQLVMESLGKETRPGRQGREPGHRRLRQQGLDRPARLRAAAARGREQLLRHLHRGAARTATATSLEVEPGVTSGDYLLGFLLGTRRALYEKRPRVDHAHRAGRDARARSARSSRCTSAPSGFYASLVEHQRLPPAGRRGGQEGGAARCWTLQRKLLAHAARGQGAGRARREELAAAIGAADEVETVFKVLRAPGRQPRPRRDAHRGRDAVRRALRHAVEVTPPRGSAASGAPGRWARAE